ncbi:hypothetical protein PIB30_102824 [Stylosanthes scabra]|uniref:Putative plant transposon protein domain-containing protein n=1 Tax=Stylosanthes scabra TaxID=79078 RepID=A0ABU6SYA0_9FABA|nr:hypothetical protein [Stylosanthes scabra]
MVLELYTNAVRTEEELASGKDYPYTSFVRGIEVDFSAAKIIEVLRIRHMILGAETDFKTRQYEDQRRQDLTPVARGWAEFIIHSMILTRNKSEITMARVVLIHSIIKGHDVRVEELIADNIAVLADGVQGRNSSGKTYYSKGNDHYKGGGSSTNHRINQWKKMKTTMMLKISIPTMNKVKKWIMKLKCIMKVLELKRTAINIKSNQILQHMNPISSNTRNTSNKDFNF